MCKSKNLKDLFLAMKVVATRNHNVWCKDYKVLQRKIQAKKHNFKSEVKKKPIKLDSYIFWFFFGDYNLNLLKLKLLFSF